MKKYLSILLIALLLFCVACQSKSDQPDVRNVRWGMTQEEVITAEGVEPDRSSSINLTFENVNVSGYDAYVLYSFRENSVKSAQYLIVTFNANDVFLDLLEKLEAVYGTPSSMFSYSEDSVSVGRFENQKFIGRNGLKVYLGLENVAVAWKTERSTIALSRKAGSYHVSVSHVDITCSELTFNLTAPKDVPNSGL